MIRIFLISWFQKTSGFKKAIPVIKGYFRFQKFHFKLKSVFKISSESENRDFKATSGLTGVLRFHIFQNFLRNIKSFKITILNSESRSVFKKVQSMNLRRTSDLTSGARSDFARNFEAYGFYEISVWMKICVKSLTDGQSTRWR